MGLPVIIRDTREQKGYEFRRSKTCAGMVVEKLDYGDYAIKDMLDLISIERKNSIDELCSCLGKEKLRFDNELDRMCAGSKLKYIIVEDYWSSIWSPRRRSKMHANAVIARIMSIEIKRGVKFIFAGTKKIAHRLTRELLVKAYQYKEKGAI